MPTFSLPRRSKQPLIPQNHRDLRVQTPPYRVRPLHMRGQERLGSRIAFNDLSWKIQVFVGHDPNILRRIETGVSRLYLMRDPKISHRVKTAKESKDRL